MYKHIILLFACTIDIQRENRMKQSIVPLHVHEQARNPGGEVSTRRTGPLFIIVAGAFYSRTFGETS